MNNTEQKSRNNDGTRAATIYIARETDALKARVANEGPLKIRDEIKKMFHVSDHTVQRLFESCGIPWKRRKQQDAVGDMLADLEERVRKLEQRLL